MSLIPNYLQEILHRLNKKTKKEIFLIDYFFKSADPLTFHNVVPGRTLLLSLLGKKVMPASFSKEPAKIIGLMSIQSNAELVKTIAGGDCLSLFYEEKERRTAKAFVVGIFKNKQQKEFLVCISAKEEEKDHLLHHDDTPCDVWIVEPESYKYLSALEFPVQNSSKIITDAFDAFYKKEKIEFQENKKVMEVA